MSVETSAITESALPKTAPEPAAAPETTTLTDLAAKVSELTQQFAAALKEKNIPQPTFAADSPPSYAGLTGEMFMLRQQLADCINDLWYLSQGPTESVMNWAHTIMPDVATLNLLNYFDFWSAVPLNGTATYEEIAKHVELPYEGAKRIIEHATTLRFFDYVDPHATPIRIKHTSRSAAFVHSKGLSAQVSCLLDDAGPPLMVMNEALEKYVRGRKELPTDLKESAFSLFHSSGTYGGKFTNSWELLENHGEGDRKGWRQDKFVEFMRFIKDIFGLEAIVENAIDWKSLGDAKVIDLGGSGGHDSFVLAKKFPNLSVTVQDLGKAEKSFDQNIPDELKDRVKFMAHNFFDPQPLEADVIIIKLIFHDWPTQDAIKILQALRPSLKAGTRILFIDYVGKEKDAGGEIMPRSIQQMGTSTDIRMMALFNTEEHPASYWKDTIKQADERFEVVKYEANPMTFILCMEIVWKG